MSDEELLNYFQDGRSKGQFSHYWDNLGDAYEDYAALANAFLVLVAKTGMSPKDFKNII